MSRIRWRDAMVVDRGLIDEDHRHLIDIINRFGDEGSRGRGGLAVAVDVLHALQFYAETHFEREEQLQRLVNYPEQALHHDEHRRLTATLDDMIAKAGSITDDGASVVQEVSALLSHWLLDHVIKMDLRMKPYGALMSQHASGLPELRAVARNPRVSVPSR